MDQKTKNFISHVRRECKKHKIDFKLVNRKNVYLALEKTKCNGYFDEVKLCCAINKSVEDWLPILVHEYSHMEQWLDKKSKIWEVINVNGEDISDQPFLWAKGIKRIKRDKLEDCVKRVRTLELDCEKRVVVNIKKFKLPINIKTYIQKANTYVYFYHWILARKKWYKIGQIPYEIEEIYSQMPIVFRESYAIIPQKYLKLFDKYC